MSRDGPALRNLTLSIARTLPNEDKANAERQHALSISYEKIGDVNVQRNNVTEAGLAAKGVSVGHAIIF